MEHMKITVTACAIAATLSLISCNDRPKLENQAPPSTTSEVFRPGETDYFTRINNKDFGTSPTNYYSTIELSNSGIPTGKTNCGRSDYYGIKKIFGIEEENNFILTASISTNGEKIYDNIPILVIERNDTDNTCSILAPSGYISQEFVNKKGITTQIDIKAANAEAINLTTLSKLLDAASTATPAAAFSTIASTAGKPIARELEKLISESLRKIQKTGVSSTISTSPPSGEVNYRDKSILHVGALFGEALQEWADATITFSYAYSRTKLGSPARLDSTPVYPTSPDSLLSSQTISTDQNSTTPLLSALNIAPEEGYFYPTIREATKESTKSACTHTKNMLNKLVMTDDDKLITLWATLNKGVSYDNNPSIQSNDCMSMDEIIKVYNKLGLEESSISSSGILETQDIVNSFVDSIFYEQNKNTPKIQYDSTVMPTNFTHPTKSDDPAEFLKKWFSQETSCYARNALDDRNLYIGYFQKLVNTHYGNAKLYSMKDTSVRVPAVIHYNKTSKSIKSVKFFSLLEKDMYHFPENWPFRWEGNCPTQEMSTAFHEPF